MAKYISTKKLILEKQKKNKNIIQKNKMEIKNISPLRYPGGKTRACRSLDEILQEYFHVEDFENIVSPFFGGGSFEFYVQNKYDLKIIANDKFTPLYNFWDVCKTDKKKLCKKLYKKINLIDKSKFSDYRSKIMNEKNKITQSFMYFIINRCSFSGATLSGGFSLESSKNRFTKSSIDRIEKLDLSNFEIYNYDFKKFINKKHKKDCLLFLDPPYYLEKKSKLYGNNGDMHENFDHEKLYKCLSKKINWILTYNNCEYIKKLYKDFTIIEISWSYGMNKSKKSSEIVIIG
jgi:DNA adenine methylase